MMADVAVLIGPPPAAESYLSIDIERQDQYYYLSGFSVNQFRRDLRRLYRSNRVANIFELSFSLFGRGTIRIHQFFIPELAYIMGQLPPRYFYQRISELIYEKTWMKDTLRDFPSRMNTSMIGRDMTYRLESYQKNFIGLYDDRKQKYKLNGYILAFEQGLGKTFTSLALMHGLKKDVIIIFAPKSTLQTVWVNEINTVFKQPQKIWTPDKPPQDARFYIVNYESINKLALVSKWIKYASNIGIIVDESHNFRNTGAKRVTDLQKIVKETFCKDVLLMSGTPIKALGTEMIPTITLIDPMFDDEARDVFVKAFGLNTPVALDILKNRLGLLMHRKLKSDVLDLPEKKSFIIKIKFAGSDEYTIEKVKEKVLAFILERRKHYTENMDEYENNYKEVIDYIKDHTKEGKSEEFIQYLEIIKKLRKTGYNRMDKKAVRDHIIKVIKITSSLYADQLINK